MNGLNQLTSALQFFAIFIGIVIFAVFLGIIGSFVHIYFGITLFLLVFIAGVAGSIKNYLTLPVASQPHL